MRFPNPNPNPNPNPKPNPNRNPNPNRAQERRLSRKGFLLPPTPPLR